MKIISQTILHILFVTFMLIAFNTGDINQIVALGFIGIYSAILHMKDE